MSFFSAALVYRVFRKTEKIYTKLIHMSLQAVVMIMVVVGLVTVFDFHNAQKIPNMYSLHSWIGLSSVILFFLQVIFLTICYLYFLSMSYSFLSLLCLLLNGPFHACN